MNAPACAALFYEAGIYHVYNSTNNQEPLFLNAENRRFFLQKYVQYVAPFCDTLCYHLLPDHFHFMIRVKPEAEILRLLQECTEAQRTKTEEEYLNNKADTDALLCTAWLRFFTSYSMAFNKVYNRKGNLFHRPFKRVALSETGLIKRMVVFIHNNRQFHGYKQIDHTYNGSSYGEILSAESSVILVNQVLDWFGGREGYINAHTGKQIDYYPEMIEI